MVTIVISNESTLNDMYVANSSLCVYVTKINFKVHVLLEQPLPTHRLSFNIFYKRALVLLTRLCFNRYLVNF